MARNEEETAGVISINPEPLADGWKRDARDGFAPPVHGFLRADWSDKHNRLFVEVHWRAAMTTDPAVCGQNVTPDLIRSKTSRQITFVTAYDFPTPKLAGAPGFDMVLVGDTLAEVVLGHETTLPATFDTMLHHTCAERRGIKRALLVADLPYGTYQVSEDEAIGFAMRFVKEGAGGEAGGRAKESCAYPPHD